MAETPIVWEKPILIGSCPSSGSTLLSVMLHAHPDVLCGPELAMFSHPFFWTMEGPEWRDRLLTYMSADSTTLFSSNWTLANGVCPYNLLLYVDTLPWYGLTLDYLRDAIHKSSCALELVQYIYEPVLRAHNKWIWAEKSPPNIYSFGAFLERYPNGRAIYLVRDGRDVVCSLMRRNFGFKRALSIWLMETELANYYYNHPRVFRVRYEDLVLNTRQTIEELLDFLDLYPHVDHVLNYFKTSSRAVSNDPSVDAVGSTAWLNTPREPISTKSIGIWQDVLTPEQLEAISSAAIVQELEGSVHLQKQTAINLFAQLDYTPFEQTASIDEEKLLQLIMNEGLFLSGDDYINPRIFQERFVECDIERLPDFTFSWSEKRLTIKLASVQKELANTIKELTNMQGHMQQEIGNLQTQQAEMCRLLAKKSGFLGGLKEIARATINFFSG